MNEYLHIFLIFKSLFLGFSDSEGRSCILFYLLLLTGWSRLNKQENLNLTDTVLIIQLEVVSKKQQQRNNRSPPWVPMVTCNSSH